MREWLVTNLNTGETKKVEAYDNVTACEMLGWKLSYCDVWYDDGLLDFSERCNVYLLGKKDRPVS